MTLALRNVFSIIAALALAAGCASMPAPDAGISGKTEIWWLGQAAMRITTPEGKVIMIDPWIMGNPKTPAELKTSTSSARSTSSSSRTAMATIWATPSNWQRRTTLPSGGLPEWISSC